MPFLGGWSVLKKALLWTGSAMVFGAATARMGSMELNIGRLVLALGYLGLTILVLGLDVHLSAEQYIYLGVSGIIGLSLGDTFLFKAFQQIGARLSMLIMALAPAITACLAFFFLHESISFVGVLGMVVTIAGVSVVVLERKEGATSGYRISASGVINGLLGALGQAVGLIFAKEAFMAGEINGLVATAIRISASLIILLPLAVMTRRFNSPHRTFVRDRKGFFLVAVGAVLGPYLGITFSLIAVANTHAGIAATLMAIVPILMLPLVRYVQKEQLSWKAIGGAFVAVAGVAMLFLR